MLHVMSPHEESIRERVKIFEWHLKAAQLRPIAYIFVVYTLNDLNMCQLYII